MDCDCGFRARGAARREEQLIDEFGKRLYAVTARFTTPPTPDTEYWLAGFRKANG